jgi:hypothetical protein
MPVFARFKLFKGTFINVISPELLAEVKAFADDPNVSARSIGIEYLEHDNSVVVSLGFSNETDHSKVEFDLALIGNLNTNSLEDLEFHMAHHAAELGNVICHEFFVTETGDMYAIFMRQLL